MAKVRFGYRKLSKEEADSGTFGPKGLREAKIPEWTPTIMEIKRRVIADEPYQAIVDWLNDEGVEPGPYVKSGKWNAKLLRDFLRDPILHGTRTFRDTIAWNSWT